MDSQGLLLWVSNKGCGHQLAYTGKKKPVPSSSPLALPRQHQTSNPGTSPGLSRGPLPTWRPHPGLPTLRPGASPSPTLRDVPLGVRPGPPGPPSHVTATRCSAPGDRCSAPEATGTGSSRRGRDPRPDTRPALPAASLRHERAPGPAPAAPAPPCALARQQPRGRRGQHARTRPAAPARCPGPGGPPGVPGARLGRAVRPRDRRGDGEAGRRGPSARVPGGRGGSAVRGGLGTALASSIPGRARGRAGKPGGWGSAHRLRPPRAPRAARSDATAPPPSWHPEGRCAPWREPGRGGPERPGEGGRRGRVRERRAQARKPRQPPGGRKNERRESASGTTSFLRRLSCSFVFWRRVAHPATQTARPPAAASRSLG